MADIESLYKKENGRILIEIKLSSVAQLFNSFDPAPFHEKELDSAAEHCIVDMVKDYPFLNVRSQERRCSDFSRETRVCVRAWGIPGAFTVPSEVSAANI